MGNIRLIEEKCCGCGVCMNICPYGSVEIKGKKAVILETCCQCRTCVSSCKFSAIELGKEDYSDLTNNIEDFEGVWVYCEQKAGKLNNVAFELLGEGKRLANQLGVPLSAVVFGRGLINAADELVAYGADIVHKVEHEMMEYFNDQIYTDALVDLVKKYKPEILLIGATTYGRSIAPRVASRLLTGLTADCTQLDVDVSGRALLQTRPAFGGELMATIKCSGRRPQMATVRPRVMKAMEADYSRKGQIMEHKIDTPDNLRMRILEIVNSTERTCNLADSDIIISVGRGIEDSKNIKLIQKLAEILGASVGASRAVVDSGWIGYEHQIGQTGKTVKPKIYFACGISGAVQHLAGMSSSDTIIAINKNPEAPIFKIANYGIVGDLKEILPELIREFKYENPSLFKEVHKPYASSRPHLMT